MTDSNFEQIKSFDEILNLHWRDFEYFCAFLLKKSGYQNVKVTTKDKNGKDGGVDIEAEIKESSVAVQCKHWSENYRGSNKEFYISVNKVRELNGIIKYDKAIFMTTITFSKIARMEFANSKGVIRLIDKFDICQKMKEINSKFFFDEKLLNKNIFDFSLFDDLKKLRTYISKELSQVPYYVFVDKTLEEIATLKPKNKEEFLQISGVGEIKYNWYGEIFINAIQDYLLNKPINYDFDLPKINKEEIQLQPVLSEFKQGKTIKKPKKKFYTKKSFIGSLVGVAAVFAIYFSIQTFALNNSDQNYLEASLLNNPNIENKIQNKSEAIDHSAAPEINLKLARIIRKDGDCPNGYNASSDKRACIRIEMPKNAHLVGEVNNWSFECSTGFIYSGENCIKK